MIQLDPYKESQEKFDEYYEKGCKDALEQLSEELNRFTFDRLERPSRSAKDIKDHFHRLKSAYKREEQSVIHSTYINPKFVMQIFEKHNTITNEDYITVKLSDGSTVDDSSATAEEFLLKNAIAGQDVEKA